MIIIAILLLLTVVTFFLLAKRYNKVFATAVILFVYSFVYVVNIFISKII